MIDTKITGKELQSMCDRLAYKFNNPDQISEEMKKLFPVSWDALVGELQ